MNLTTRTAHRWISALLFLLVLFFPLTNVVADTIKVKVSSLNVRLGPDLEFEVLEKIHEGEIYTVRAKQNGWIEIELNDGRIGWVADWLVDYQHAEVEVRVIEAKVDKLNVRTGPSTSFPKLDQISPGQTYTIIKEEGDWVYIQLSDTVSGWVARNLVESKTSLHQETTSYNKNKATISGDLVNVRSGPKTTFDPIGQLKKGTVIQILEVEDGWFKIEFEGKEGWIAGQYARKDEADKSNKTAPNLSTTVEVKTNVLNLRSDPTLEADVLTKLNKGTQAELISTEGEWVQIKIQDGTIGWVANWLIAEVGDTITNQPTIKILNQGTNLRSGPSTKEKVVATANTGDIFPVIGTSGDWFQIKLKDGTKAYVAGWIVAAEGIPNIVHNPLQDTLKGKVIVVDAGHGGKDEGATGPGKKTKEKVINLQVAKILETKLKSAGATVVMTRNRDVYLTLEDRVNIAIQANADAFISIHHNTFKNSSMNGSITFHYSQDRDKKLAEYIQAELTKRNGLKDLGTRFGDYYVLRENPQLAVLVELGFLTNPNEELVIRTSKFQENSAEGIFQGVLKYFK